MKNHTDDEIDCCVTFYSFRLFICCMLYNTSNQYIEHC